VLASMIQTIIIFDVAVIMVTAVNHAREAHKPCFVLERNCKRRCIEMYESMFDNVTIMPMQHASLLLSLWLISCFELYNLRSYCVMMGCRCDHIVSKENGRFPVSYFETDTYNTFFNKHRVGFRTNILYMHDLYYIKRDIEQRKRHPMYGNVHPVFRRQPGDITRISRLSARVLLSLLL
jgi:hypothetical protein